MSRETAHAGSKPLWYVAGLPEFPDITVMAQPLSAEAFHLDYSGWPADLVAVGVMEQEWIVPSGKHLRDPDGGKVSVSRRWRLVSPELPPRRYCVVARHRPLSDLARWPGAAEALEAYRRYRRVPPPRPTLRLVVDNTQKGAAD